MVHFPPGLVENVLSLAEHALYLVEVFLLAKWLEWVLAKNPVQPQIRAGAASVPDNSASATMHLGRLQKAVDKLEHLVEGRQISNRLQNVEEAVERLRESQGISDRLKKMEAILGRLQDGREISGQLLEMQQAWYRLHLQPRTSRSSRQAKPLKSDKRGVVPLREENAKYAAGSALWPQVSGSQAGASHSGGSGRGLQ